MPNKKLNNVVSLYEALKDKAIRQALNDIEALFNAALNKSVRLAARRRLISNRYLPKDLQDKINSIFEKVAITATETVENGIKDAWDIAEQKNAAILKDVVYGTRKVGKRLKTIDVPEADVNGTFYRRGEGLDAFLTRRDKGLNLSQRIWKVTQQYKTAMNEELIKGILSGKPSYVLRKKIADNLLVNKYQSNPGRGIYKNPLKNAWRVTRTEINMAYNTSDFERWQKQWFVVGIEVRISNNHPDYDICDEMKGKYPKDFHFIGWHPQCKCVAIPVLAPQSVRDDMMDYQLGLRKNKPAVNMIDTRPEKSIAWVKENAHRIKEWKNTPYWVLANPQYYGNLAK